MEAKYQKLINNIIYVLVLGGWPFSYPFIHLYNVGFINGRWFLNFCDNKEDGYLTKEKYEFLLVSIGYLVEGRKKAVAVIGTERT